MGKAPKVVIIARHGVRMDGVDPEWELNSATPYDPPLSYGGWTQARALGAKIASLLRERDVAAESDDSERRRDSEGSAPHPTEGAGPKKWRHKVIIHSSPFLRCVQTSIGISAGMIQYQGNLERFDNAGRKTERSGRAGRKPRRSQTLDTGTFDSRYSAETASSSRNGHAETGDPKDKPQTLKPTLRLDAFLGEWLSTEYFEHITPPPGSKTMMENAKTDLAHSATPVQKAQASSEPILETDGEDDLETLNDEKALPVESQAEETSEDKVTRTTSRAEDSNGKNAKVSMHKPRHKSISLGYAPPVALYVTSATDPIPRGFVAHARDACVSIDFQWDSMNAPQSWPDGGEYGEEWRTMHRRFRRGLMDMLTWYKLHGAFYDPQADSNSSTAAIEEGGGEDKGEDSVVVIVTHGAGCNALIGALTNQPVLMDVGMASLTMAVHKGTDSSQLLSRRTSSSGRKASVDCSQSEEYEVKLVASTEHLRAGHDPLKIPQLQSPRLLPISEQGRRDSSLSSNGSGPRDSENARPRNSALGSIRRNRAATGGLGLSDIPDSARSSGSAKGLWGSTQASMDEEQSSSIGIGGAKQRVTFAVANEQKSSSTGAAMGEKKPPSRSNSQHGLWGGSSPKQPPARRWTIEDH